MNFDNPETQIEKAEREDRERKERRDAYFADANFKERVSIETLIALDFNDDF